MNAKNIREILISYLKATNGEIRIYKEKSIGSSICDIMAVTNKLTGYEIKSDLDNYTRLGEQIKAYNLFFDENYLVISDGHLKSASEKIPDNWGIICIRNNDIQILRTASGNSLVSRRRQLSILWKLELKNLLMKNKMPLYAQKEKGFIADRIAALVDGKTLGKQIAEELMHRDYSIYDATDYTIYSEGVEAFPAEEIVDILSENNLSTLTLDKWIALYKQATAVKEQKETIYKKPVAERTVHAIPYTDIEVSLGVPWISPLIINDFLYHILNKSHLYWPEGNVINYVDYEEVTGCWHISQKRQLGENNTNAEVKYGLKRYNALFILEATLNLREIKLYDTGNVYNEKDTMAAIEKQKLINEEFKNWMWQDEDRRWMVEDAYNKIFSKYEKTIYDGSSLKFPDMSSKYELFSYQKDAVQKILNSKNTLLAFDVGAGKTYIMIAAAMKMRSEGISRKNLFVVPNHIVGQWEKIFTELYPKAKVLAVEPKTFKPDMRYKVLKQMRDGDYDGIIMAYSCFEMIPLSADIVLSNMDAQLKRLEDALRSMQYSSSYSRSFTTPLSNEKKYIIKLTNEFLDSMNPSNSSDITFDQLEINTLFVDEAHNYKNIPIRTNLKNLNGINTKGSIKCQDLLHKVRHIQQNNGGRGVVFATGTPLCNSISDAYAIQMYLQYDELQKSHLDVFDNWVKTFAKPEQICEIDVDASKFRFVRKFSKFFNLPELSNMFSQIAIFYATNNAEFLPDFKGYTDVVIEKFAELTDYMQNLCKRTEKIRNKEVDRKYDNMLKVSTDGRKAALDLKLVGQTQPYNEFSKVYRCVKNVYDIYCKHPETTQLIFCDYSTPKGDDFSVYAELKARLEESGIPKKEIAFIHSYKTESRKLELFRKFNSGEIRILIGSTFKLGIGANVQVKLKAIHHLDVPWRPADMIQREGRIVRRGNENKDVMIFRYITRGSFDSYSWQILETKQRFISQFLSGSSYQRTASDLENNVLTYAEVKALALSEPLMKQLAEKENEIQNLKIIISKECEAKKRMEEELNDINSKMDILYTRYITTRRILLYIEDKTNDDFLKAYNSIKELLTEDVLYKKVDIPQLPSVIGFEIQLPKVQDTKKPYIYLCCQNESFIVEMGTSANGNAKRIINTLKRFNKVSENALSTWKKATERRQELETALCSVDDGYITKLRECEAEVKQIKKIISMNKTE